MYYIRQNPKTSVSDLVNKLAKKGSKVGRETIRTHFHTFGYKMLSHLRHLCLQRNIKKKRVEWAQKDLNDNWKKTLFTDETSFQLFRNTITQWYKNKRCIRPIPKN